jgi:hypothetical protein
MLPLLLSSALCLLALADAGATSFSGPKEGSCSSGVCKITKTRSFKPTSYRGPSPKVAAASARTWLPPFRYFGEGTANAGSVLVGDLDVYNIW